MSDPVGSSKGSRPARPGLSGRLRSWGVRHAQNFLASLGDLVRHPASSLMTVSVIGITLALPAGLHVVIQNTRTLSGTWENPSRMSVFLQPDLTLAEARRLGDDLVTGDEYVSVEVIDPAEALAEFREHSGFGAAVDVLEGNPLPPVLVLEPSPELSPAIVAGMARRLETRPEVDMVALDSEWIARFRALVEILQRAVSVIAVLLAAAVMIIVGNTIRLDIQNRRDEIEVMKLIGASDAFIRRPFLYTGLWYGLMGGLLAWVLVGITMLVLDGPVRRLAGLYGSDFGLEGLRFAGVLAVLAGGALLGWLGSWFAVARHLRAIEPT